MTPRRSAGYGLTDFVLYVEREERWKEAEVRVIEATSPQDAAAPAALDTWGPSCGVGMLGLGFTVSSDGFFYPPQPLGLPLRTRCR